MRRGSLVGPLFLIVIGFLFLMNNLRPELSVMSIIAAWWPFLLIGWGVLRLIEIMYWAGSGKALPMHGISGGEWVLVVFLGLFGSGAFTAMHRDRWPGFNVRLRGLELLGEPYDYQLPERQVGTGGSTSLRLVVDAFRGNARITGADSSEVRVSGRKTVRAMDKEEADRISNGLQWEVVRQGDDIHVRPTGSDWSRGRNEFVSSDLEITVPRNIRIEAHGRRGDFDITDVNGDVDLDSDNAGVRLQNVAGNVRIELRASDIVRAIGVRGDVEIRGSGHDVELENVAGQVTVGGNYVGDLQFRQIAKPVKFEGASRGNGTELRVEACPGQIRIERGNMQIENVIGPVVVQARSKDVTISDFTNALDLHVDRGDLEVNAGVTPVPRMAVVTNSGNLEVTLPENGKFALRASVDRGEIENDYGPPFEITQQHKGATLAGNVGSGPDLTFHSNRGTVRLRKGGPADAAVRPPAAPAKPIPPDAAKSIRIEKN